MELNIATIRAAIATDCGGFESADDVSVLAYWQSYGDSGQAELLRRLREAEADIDRV